LPSTCRGKKIDLHSNDYSYFNWEEVLVHWLKLYRNEAANSCLGQQDAKKAVDAKKAEDSEKTVNAKKAGRRNEFFSNNARHRSSRLCSTVLEHKSEHLFAWKAVFGIRDVYPGFQIRNFSILKSASKNLNILTQKMVSKLPEIWSGLFIPDSDPDILPIPDPGSRGQKGTGSRIQICNTGWGAVYISLGSGTASTEP
jgi:hypothetical protein